MMLSWSSKKSCHRVVAEGRARSPSSDDVGEEDVATTRSHPAPPRTPVTNSSTSSSKSAVSPTEYSMSAPVNSTCGPLSAPLSSADVRWNVGGIATVQNQRRTCDAFENVTHVSLYRDRAHGAGHGRRCRTTTRKVPRTCETLPRQRPTGLPIRGHRHPARPHLVRRRLSSRRWTGSA